MHSNVIRFSVSDFALIDVDMLVASFYLKQRG